MPLLKIIYLTAIENLYQQYLDQQLESCSGQKWFYVILSNANALTVAGKELQRNLNLLDLDSGENCNYSLAGYCPYPMYKRFRESVSLLEESEEEMLFGPARPAVVIDRLGPLYFSDTAFVDIYKSFERTTAHAWRYSGECELLVFQLKKTDTGKVMLDKEEFSAYNLDDIVRNQRTVTEFLKAITMITEDSLGVKATKQAIDEKYAEIITPTQYSINGEYAMHCAQQFRITSYANEPYTFISYSSKDYLLVKQLRDRLETSGRRCWMAPFSIPAGTNYAYVIELAIKHADQFILCLSEAAIYSVWVGKELKRAIDRFQQKQPEKIRVLWCNGPIDLDDTPFALPLEDVQIVGDLCGSADNYTQLLTE